MAIELSHLLFYYADKPNKPILNIPSWSLRTGEQVFLFGSSGIGKSTLLNILSGLLPVKKGQLMVFEKQLDKMTARQRDSFRANNIGFISQQFNLIPYLDAIDNIQLANHFSEQDKSFDLNKEIKALLTSLNMPEHDWHTPVRKLSIGQQQRVGIARALINKPKLLIADEPTSALDQMNRDAFMELLMSIVTKNKITLLFVSHDMTLSRYFPRVESLHDINVAEKTASCL